MTTKEKTKVGKLLAGFWSAIASLFKKADAELKVLLPKVIEAVNNTKFVTDSEIFDIIAFIVPGDKDDKLVAKLRELMPKIVVALGYAQEISNEPDANKKMQMILAKINVAPDDTRKAFYTSLAGLLIEKGSDGKFDWADAVSVGQLIYRNKELLK